MTGQNIGYARVSINEQDTSIQMEQLQNAGCLKDLTGSLIRSQITHYEFREYQNLNEQFLNELNIDPIEKDIATLYIKET
jgi:uncharacterized protein YlbG (UPF0298 family)